MHTSMLLGRCRLAQIHVARQAHAQMRVARIDSVLAKV